MKIIKSGLDTDESPDGVRIFLKPNRSQIKVKVVFDIKFDDDDDDLMMK